MIGRTWQSWSGMLLLVASVATPAAAGPTETPAGAAGARAEGTVLELPFAAGPELADVGRRLGRLPGGTREKADAIVRYIFSDADGLEFEYRRYPTLTAEEAFHQRAGNCMSLVNLFIALARSAGLDAFPIEVEDFAVFSRREGAVVRSTHMIGGLSVGGYARFGQLWTIDFLPDQEKAYRRFSRISDERHAALHYNAVAVEVMLAGDLERAERLFAHALTLAGGTAEVWNNAAVLARRRGDLDRAFARLEEALERDRAFLPALTNMAGFHRIAGRPEIAAEYERRALEAKLQNPYFLIDQSLRRLARGEIEGAYELLRRARRIDGSIPEVYLALGRVDLARGRVERAERYFTTARERSQELAPGFQRKLDRKIDKLLHLASAG